ncbi:MAG: ribosome silencing factor [Bacteroidales bacterium]|jgi:ribosome-associated protein|nr:ribosome silencing factor [Bacteroidales bacterium]MDD4702845.1 ribosome silencing factor [Bacteroidales bacterium]MDX9797495.1 ribosome silencing factor [Bacteroidales bacterium]
MAVRKNTNKSSQMLTDIAIKGIQDKKGKDITIISLKEIEGSLFDYYIVCTGNSPSHIDTITEAIDKEIKLATGINPKRIEGLQNCQWVLLDYFDVIIHVMLQETRDFYRIEQMWKDAPQTHLENVQ